MNRIVAAIIIWLSFIAIVAWVTPAQAASVYSNRNNIDTLFDAVNEMQDIEYKHYSDNHDFISAVEKRMDRIHKRDTSMLMGLINRNFRLAKTNELKIKRIEDVIMSALERLDRLEGKDAPVKKISTEIKIFKK